MKVDWRLLLLVLLVALAIWLPRAFALDSFVATDEGIWLWRSANFYYALGQNDFAATAQSNHPGVVIMWIETAALLIEFPEYRGLGQGILDKYLLFENLITKHGIHPHTVLVTSRMITVLFNTLILTAAFIFGRRLFGTGPALVGFLLIASEPYQIAITRLAHLDGPLSSLQFISLIAFMVYLYRGEKFFALLVSAIAGGLALLAKLPGVIIAPSIAIIAFIPMLNTHKHGTYSRNQKMGLLLKKFLTPMILWGLVFLITLVVFFPALWQSPIRGIGNLLFIAPLSYANQSGENNSDAINEMVQESIPWTARLSEMAGYSLRYPSGYLWRATPVILAGLILAAMAYWRKYSVLQDKATRKAVFGMLAFIIIYTVFLTITPKSSPKYYSPIYPNLALIAGLGWHSAVQWLIRHISTRWRKFVFAGLISLVILIQAAGALSTFPYYFTYFNPLLGGSRRAGQVVASASGWGLDQAAHYLNAKPNAEDLKVYSWYGSGPFSYYFVGETTSITSAAKISRHDVVVTLSEMDYLVTYNNQWLRGIPRELFKLLEGVTPEYSVWVNNIELARIYKVSQIPLE